MRGLIPHLSLILACLLCSQSHAAKLSKSLSDSETLGNQATISITLYPASISKAQQILKETLQEAKKIYQDLDSRSSGIVAKINKNAGKKELIPVSDDLLQLFKACMQIYDWTEGFFDVIKVRRSAKIHDPQLHVSFETQEAFLPDSRTQIDFYGILNGYVIDRATGHLKSKGIENFLVKIGENVRTLGRNGPDSWRINIPDPSGNGTTLCRVALDSTSIATTNLKDKEDALKRVGRTATKASDLQSVTVLTTNATNATALAATGLVVGHEKAFQLLSKISSNEQGSFGAILKDQKGKITSIGNVTAACFEE